MTKFAFGLAFGCVMMGAQAGFKDMEEMLVGRFNDRANASRGTDSLRGAGFTNYFKGQIQDIVNSGCWCYFDDDHHKARGKPVNVVDAYCKILHHGYQCAVMDAGPDCVPWAVQYIPSSGLGTHEQIYEECKFNNGGTNCAAYACSIENNFVNKIYEYFDSSMEFDTSVKHSEGFVADDNCPTGGNFIQSEKECCADYPERFPFRNLSGGRACCIDKTYDTSVFGCCPDSTLSSICL